MYRKTSKYKKQCEKLVKMRRVKKGIQLESLPLDYSQELPELRKRITIETFDFGYKKQIIELHKTSRVDSYDAYIQGKLWKKRIGLSKIFEWLRKANPRIMSSRNI